MNKKVAILYQALPPPEFDGISKPMKQGGYSDSGADIANALKASNTNLVTSADNPKPENDYDWVFPDTHKGINMAIEKGATILWLNTVLFADHPITDYTAYPIELIGQQPADVERFDQKVYTNQLLSEAGLPVPETKIVDPFSSLPEMEFPAVIKPLRGRGSQGVSKVENKTQLKEIIASLFEQGIYGERFYVEPFLEGQEITISVLPPGNYLIDGMPQQKRTHWALPIVERFSHVNGITPYSGVEPVSKNSRLLPSDEVNSELETVIKACEKCGELLAARALIRVDCRANADGLFSIFDVNLKPNMTGPSRPHRLAQESLTLIAGEGLGWNYTDLLINLLNQHWPASNMKISR